MRERHDNRGAHRSGIPEIVLLLSSLNEFKQVFNVRRPFQNPLKIFAQSLPSFSYERTMLSQHASYLVRASLVRRAQMGALSAPSRQNMRTIESHSVQLYFRQHTSAESSTRRR